MSPSNSPRVLTITGTPDASTDWRVVRPANALRRRDYRVDYIHKDDPDLWKIVASGIYQVLVLARITYPREVFAVGKHLVDLCHKMGMLVFYECDDDQFVHIADHLTEESDADRLAINLQSPDTLRLCDGVTVSTPRLATLVRTLTDAPVAIVPNLLDVAWFDSILYRAKRTVPGLTIGWAGAKRQEDDFAPVAQAWGAIARRYPDVRFVVAGWQPDALRGAVPNDRLTVLPWVQLTEYPALYKQIDIMCCPLADTPFNRAKTFIKAMEAGAAGCAVVASPTLYRSIIKDNDTGYLARDADEWEHWLARLVEDANLRATLGKRLRRRVVEGHDLGTRCEEWLGAWSWLRAKAEERRAA